ncbi:MAG TPA: hypothetical protein VKM72_16065 [Thermoanaerobaculia bacterium]|nr:hypothetical protein [Thermoanaerobaculia bacterium]
MSEEILANGLDGATGQYVQSLWSGLDPAGRVQGRPPLSPSELREHRWWIERFSLDDPRRTSMEDFDPQSVASAGWGVIFAQDTPPGVRRALEPLLEWRRAQAGPLFKVFEHQPGRTKLDFLRAHKAPPGPADPRQIPYYLLLVGDPRTIPFLFQHELDLQYALGRIWFESPEEYACYARSVVEHEARPRERPSRVVFFGVENEVDRATSRMSLELIGPLAAKLSEEGHVLRVPGEQATKQRLSRLLGGDETPDVLVTASHGLRFSCGDPRQIPDQGALVCRDWPGPTWQGPIPREHYFGAEDVSGAARLNGLIAFFFASYGGGTPEADSLFPDQRESPRIAPHPFIARLPQRLLGHPGGGALAVVSHTDQGYLPSSQEARVLESALGRLLTGFPLGSAMEYVNQYSAELSVQLTHLWDDSRSHLGAAGERFSRLWRTHHTMRSLAIFGDPAVRLA